MIPGMEASTRDVPSRFVSKSPRRSIPLVDYEVGGAQLGVVAADGAVQQWRMEYADGSFQISHDAVWEPQVIHSVPDVVYCSFALDGAMSPCLAYTLASGASFLWWFDTEYITTELPAGVVRPYISLDTTRPGSSGIADVVLSYIRNEQLIIRLQRQRYLEEIVRADVGSDEVLICAGMNAGSRYQWRTARVSP